LLDEPQAARATIVTSAPSTAPTWRTTVPFLSPLPTDLLNGVDACFIPPLRVV
jgi:hypothetical protein